MVGMSVRSDSPTCLRASTMKMGPSGTLDLCRVRRVPRRDPRSCLGNQLLSITRTGPKRTDHLAQPEAAMQGHPDDDALLTPSEVAAMFRVNPKTVTRWARAGKISAIRTLGGHRRFRASEIRQFLEQVEESDRI